MGIRTILVPLYGNGEDSRALATAAEIARRMQAHITALYCDADPLDPANPALGWESEALFTETMIDTLRSRAQTRRAAAESNYFAWISSSEMPVVLSSNGPRMASAQLIIATGTPERLIVDRAIVNDLVITSSERREVPDQASAIKAMLFDAGRPVIVLPAAETPTIFTAPVAIAWNHSTEAVRAVNAALPILQAVGEAVVLMAGHRDDDTAARRIAAYLSWHGIQARVLQLGEKGEPSELVADRLLHLRTGLLVMGAYSHTRAREYLLGGMTGYMLENVPVPLLLAH